ncbi:hypothetical protein P4L05_18705 [Bacillus anthracis]|nr:MULTISPECIES: hypothetical protein [Bacillus cereus group]MEC0076893.1 hypothetical protein [Bacillus anthracis]
MQQKKTASDAYESEARSNY